MEGSAPRTIRICTGHRPGARRAGLSGCGGLDDDNPLAPYAPVERPDIRGPEEIGDACSGLLDLRFLDGEELDEWDGETFLFATILEPAQ